MRQKLDENGQPIEGEYEEADEDDAEDDAEAVAALAAEQQAKFEEERKAIVANAEMLSEEKQRVLAELQSKQDRLRQEAAAKEQMGERLRLMESKLLVGGKSIVDHTREQEAALELKRRALAEQKARERKMQQDFEAKEENFASLKQNYSSLQARGLCLCLCLCVCVSSTPYNCTSQRAISSILERRSSARTG